MMKKRVMFVFHSLLFQFASVGIVYASDGSFGEQFLGSPLLILTAIIIIDIIAIIYHKIRK